MEERGLLVGVCDKCDSAGFFLYLCRSSIIDQSCPQGTNKRKQTNKQCANPQRSPACSAVSWGPFLNKGVDKAGGFALQLHPSGMNILSVTLWQPRGELMAASWRTRGELGAKLSLDTWFYMPIPIGIHRVHNMVSKAGK